MHAIDAALSGQSVLATKITAPQPRRQIVARLRLWEHLQLAADGPVTLVTAPAGFGKTTLLSAWQTQCQRGACWLTLDERDNDLARFWRYLIAALQQRHPDIGGAALAEMGVAATQVEAMLTTLVNELAAIPTEIMVVLDDYHAITLPAIHESLAFLIEHQPPQLHLIIAARATPALPLTRLRARAALGELHSSDLRFTPDEARCFLRDLMALDITNEQSDTLTLQTEGWIAGLHLAALSLRESHDVTAFIAAFAGNHRYIFDYLAEEVLRHLPEETQQFLMQTAILDRLSAGLCAAVTEQDESEGVLTAIERANLFLIALDDERCWYRYHALFADFLRAQLQQRTPTQIPLLHGRASVWYEHHDNMADAIEHALAAQDFARAASLLERVDEALFKQGESLTLLRWLAALPDEIVDDHPQLGFFYAGTLTAIGQLDAAEQRLQTIERRLAQEESPPATDGATLQLWRSEISAARTVIAAFQGNVPRMLDHHRQSLLDLPSDNPFIQSILAAGKAAAYYWSGDIVAADRELDDMLIISRRAGNVSIEVASLCLLGFVRMMQGRLREGATVFHQAMAMSERGATQVTPILALAYIGLGELHYEWNDLAAATHLLERGLAIGASWGDFRSLSYGYMMLARVTFAEKNAGAAFAIIDEAERQARQQHIDDVIGWAAASRAWLLVAQGDLAAASHWMQIAERDQNAMLGIPYQYMRLTQVRLHIAHGAIADAMQILNETMPAIQAMGAMRYVVEMTMLRALAQQAQGQNAEALQTLTQALAIGEPEGVIRTFVDAGVPLITLLEQLACSGMKVLLADVTPAYIATLLAAAGCPPTASKLDTALNERELVILRCLAAGKSNAAIAQELIVAATTVKWHLKHLYRKLDVHSRTQAIARAHTIGLLK